MNNPLVSILIPVYNTEKYVAEAIESALNQTYKNIEIIIVDDGSTDKSWEIIESYREKYPNIIKTYKQENKGACAARNKAFELSSGQYIQYLDADDLLAPDKIEHQIKYFDGSGEDDFVVNGMWGRFKENINEEINWGPHESIQKDLEPVEWILANHSSAISCWLTPRKLIQMNDGWNERLKINQDGEFFNRIILGSTKVYYCASSKIYYRTNNDKTISKAYRTKYGAIEKFKAMNEIEKIILKHENTSRTKKYLSNLYIFYFYTYYPQLNQLTRIALKKAYYFGKPTLEPQGGKVFKILIKSLGLKLTFWLRFIFGYKKWKLKE